MISNRKLKKLMQNHPVPIAPKRKGELAAYAAQYVQNPKENTEKEYRIMKKNWKPILIAAAVALSMTAVISAAVVGYYYRTPGGDIIDEAGGKVEETGNVDSIVNDSAVFGEGYDIVSVTWTKSDTGTTLAVWATQDSMELTGLTAATDEGEYPLTKSTFNVTGGYVGYTTTDIAKPTVFTLKCENPAFERKITFQPADTIPVESTSNGLTLFGTTEGTTVYIGINDNNVLDSELFRDAELSFGKTMLETVTDTEGNTYTGGSRGGTNRSDDKLTTRQDFKMPADARIASVRTPYLEVLYSFGKASALGTAPTVRLPVPCDGETLTGEWLLLDTEGFRYAINSIHRDGNTITCTTDDALTYSGTYTVSTEFATFLYIPIRGPEGDINPSGSSHEWTYDFGEEQIEKYTDENGELELYLFEMELCYEGGWELHFDHE